MKIPRRRFLHLAAGAVALPAISSIARAQTYPSRPITIVVPYAAGGATDTIGRVMAERMKSSLGQPVIVEDVTGAGVVGFFNDQCPGLTTAKSCIINYLALPGQCNRTTIVLDAVE
jgi:hypothetical protein